MSSDDKKEPEGFRNGKLEEFGFRVGGKTKEQIEDAAMLMGRILSHSGVLAYFEQKSAEAKAAGLPCGAVAMSMGMFASWAAYEAFAQPDSDGALESLIVALRQAHAALKGGGPPADAN